MSHIDLTVTAEKQDIDVSVEPQRVIEVQTPITAGIEVVLAGNIGPPGPPGLAGQWLSLTQSEYDALDPPDPDVLYVIIQ